MLVTLDSKKVLLSFVGLLILLGFYFNIALLTADAESDVWLRAPFAYDAEPLILNSTYHFIGTAESETERWLNPDFKDKEWSSFELGKKELQTLAGFQNRPGIILHRIRLKVPKELVQLHLPMALLIPNISYTRYQVFINGKLINDGEGLKYPDLIGLIPFSEQDLSAQKSELVIVIRGEYKPSDLGMSYYVKTLLGAKREFQNIYLLDERVANTKYNLILIFKAGLLLFFIILTLVTRYQRFMNYFLIFAISNTVATFFVIGRTEEFLSLNFRAVAMFNLQYVGYAALWFFVAALYEVRLKWYRYVLGVQGIILNLLLLAFTYGKWGVDLRDIFTFHYAGLTQILLVVTLLSLITYWKKPGQQIANLSSRTVAIAFLANFLIHLWTHFFATDLGNNSHQIVDILFFVFVGFLSASEFLRNQLKVQELHQNLESQQPQVELGNSATRLVHDIRKPFSNLKIALTAIQAHKFDPMMTASILAEVSSALDYGENLAQQILHSQQQNIQQLKPCVPEKIMADFLQLETANLQRHRVHLRVQIQSARGFLGSPTLVQTILQNLVNNAVEAFDQINSQESNRDLWQNREIECRFEDFQDTLGQWKCRLTVSNNGPTIPKNVLGKMFKEPITFGKSLGTGLGLTSVKKMMEQMSGDIAVYNLPKGRGVSFEMTFMSVDIDLTAVSNAPNGAFTERTLPLAMPPSKAEANGDQRSEPEHEIKKIVLVDDNPLVRMAWQLNWSEAELVLFESPEQLFIKAQAEPDLLKETDLVITDMYFDQKSPLTGIDVSRELAKLHYQRTVLCSGNGKSLDPSEGDFLMVIDKKVYDKTELSRLVARHRRWR